MSQHLPHHPTSMVQQRHTMSGHHGRLCWVWNHSPLRTVISTTQQSTTMMHTHGVSRHPIVLWHPWMQHSTKGCRVATTAIPLRLLSIHPGCHQTSSGLSGSSTRCSSTESHMWIRTVLHRGMQVLDITPTEHYWVLPLHMVKACPSPMCSGLLLPYSYG